MEGWKRASVSVKNWKCCKRQICENGCWGKFCQIIFIGIFITIIINPLCFQLLFTAEKEWSLLQKSWTASQDLKSWDKVKPSEQKGARQKVTKAVPAVGLLIHFSCPKLKITFSSSPAGLSLPQSTNNKQLSNKKVIFARRNHLEISMLWPTNVLPKGYPILTFPFFQE